MRVYPKGCRYIRVANGEISEMFKIRHRESIEGITIYSYDQWLIVQPRGRQRWYVFKCNRREPAVMRAAPTQDPHALAMAVLLGALQ